MRVIFKNWLGSFDNDKGGYSARKLSAFVAVMIAALITYYFCDTSVVKELVAIWLIFALLCLGIITAEQIVRFKNGSVQQDKPK